MLKRAILDMRSSTVDRKTCESFKPSAFSKRKTTKIGNGFPSTQADSGMGSLNSTPKPIIIVSLIVELHMLKILCNCVFF